MKYSTSIFWRSLVFSVAILEIASGYPVDKQTTILHDPDVKETRYPNGTVVGKYNYTDSEGNPISVKYYADDASYGVELKSVKTVDMSKEEQFWPTNNYDTMKPIEQPLDFTSEFLAVSNTGLPKTDSKNKDKKIKPYKVVKPADYETFYQKEIKGTRDCDKGMVRVYLDKEKKIIKRALDNYQAAQYCNRI